MHPTKGWLGSCVELNHECLPFGGDSKILGTTLIFNDVVQVSFSARLLPEAKTMRTSEGALLEAVGVAREQVQAPSKENVLDALSRSATRLREKLGETLASVQKFDVPLEATTSSLEALKAYSMVGRTVRTRGNAAAIPICIRAVELDPTFAARLMVRAPSRGEGRKN